MLHTGVRLSSTHHPSNPAPVVALRPGADGEPAAPRSRRGTPAIAIAMLLAALYGVSPVVGDAYYDFATWAPLALITVTVLLATLLVRAPRLDRVTVLTLAGLAGLAVWAAVSAIWAESQENAFREAGQLGLYAATLGLGATLFDRPRHGQVGLMTLWAALSIPIGYCTIRLLAGTGGSLFVDHRLGNPVGYVNGEAGALMIGFWCFAAVAEQARNRVLAGLSAALAVVSVDLLVMTQARAIVPALLVSVLVVLALLPGRVRRLVLLCVVFAAAIAALPVTLDVFKTHGASLHAAPAKDVMQKAAIVALLGGLLAGAVWVALAAFAKRRQPSRRARTTLAAAIVAVLVIGTVGGIASVNDPLGKVRQQYDNFKSLRNDMTVTNRFVSGGGYRYDLWRISLLEFKRRPLLGIGAGNYPTAFNLERRSPQFIRQPHSLPLQTLAELGIPGFALLLLFVGGAVAAAVRARHSPHRAMVVAGVGMFTAWLVHTSIDWLHLLPGITGMALIGICLLIAARAPAEGNAELSGRRARPVLIAVLLLCALLAAGVGRLFVAERYRISAARTVEADPRRAVELADKSISIDGDLLEAYYTRAAAMARLGDYPAARGALLQAAAREPRNYVPYVLLGDLATRRGDRAAARRAYAQANRLDPFDVAHGAPFKIP